MPTDAVPWRGTAQGSGGKRRESSIWSQFLLLVSLLSISNLFVFCLWHFLSWNRCSEMPVYVELMQQNRLDSSGCDSSFVLESTSLRGTHSLGKQGGRGGWVLRFLLALKF